MISDYPDLFKLAISKSKSKSKSNKKIHRVLYNCLREIDPKVGDFVDDGSTNQCSEESPNSICLSASRTWFVNRQISIQNHVFFVFLNCFFGYAFQPNELALFSNSNHYIKKLLPTLPQMKNSSVTLYKNISVTRPNQCLGNAPN